MKSSVEKTEPEVKHYVIFSYTDTMYFNTSHGWGTLKDATIFTQLQKDSYALPISCCYWMEVVENKEKVKTVVIDIYDGEPIVSQCPGGVEVQFVIHNQKYGDDENK
jgi:hypothetical protein